VLAAKRLIEPSKRRLMRLTGWVLKNPRIYAMAGRLGRFALRWAPRWLVYNRFNAWGWQRELPAPPKKSFRQLHEKVKVK
jgi:L-lactate dehydrogenase complex protein LldF